MVAPYRFIDLYLRSALSEHWAFVWPPLILWAAVSPRVNGRLRAVLVAAGVAMLLLTNLPMAAIFGFSLACWFAVSKRVRDRTSVLLGAGLGFSASAFALAPQALSSRLLDTEVYYGGGAGNFRPSANTLFSGGLGTWNLNTVFSLVVLTTAILAAAAYLALGRARRDRGARLALFATVVIVLATSRLLGPIWDITPVYSKLQFPWRLTSVLTLILAALVARIERRRAWAVVAVTILAAAPFASWGRTEPASAFLPPQPPESAAGTVFPDPYAAWQAGSGGWYWRHQCLAEPWLLPKHQKSFVLADLAGVPVAELDLIRNRPAAVVDQPAAAIEVVRWGQIERELEVKVSESGELMWRVIWFPDMIATVDGRVVESAPHPVTGLMSHRVPAGNHRVGWRWRPFPALSAARVVSLVAVAAIAGLAIAAGRGSRRPE
jgi:hypothetical protein